MFFCTCTHNKRYFKKSLWGRRRLRGTFTNPFPLCLMVSPGTTSRLLRVGTEEALEKPREGFCKRGTWGLQGGWRGQEGQWWVCRVPSTPGMVCPPPSHHSSPASQGDSCCHAEEAMPQSPSLAQGPTSPGKSPSLVLGLNFVPHRRHAGGCLFQDGILSDVGSLDVIS